VKTLLRTLAAVAYVVAATVLYHVLEQPIEEAISFDAYGYSFGVLAFAFGLLIGRWWAIALGLAIIPISAPSWEGGCSELCSQGIAILALTPLSLIGLAAGVLVRVLGRHLAARSASHSL